MNDVERPKRTAAATATRMRKRQEREADHLVSEGWAVVAPDGENWTLRRERLERESEK